MTELSLNLLDIAQNSIKADATLIVLSVKTAGQAMTLTVEDNGHGMTAEQAEKVTDPFFTTRTTRKVGLGIPFLKMGAELTGGWFGISSEVGKGTVIKAVYNLDHINVIPLGDMASTMVTLVSGCPEIHFVYEYESNGKGFCLDTREVKRILEGVPVNDPQVLAFIRGFINENMQMLENET